MQTGTDMQTGAKIGRQVQRQAGRCTDRLMVTVNEEQQDLYKMMGLNGQTYTHTDRQTDKTQVNKLQAKRIAGQNDL